MAPYAGRSQVALAIAADHGGPARAGPVCALVRSGGGGI